MEEMWRGVEVEKGSEGMGGTGRGGAINTIAKNRAQRKHLPTPYARLAANIAPPPAHFNDIISGVAMGITTTTQCNMRTKTTIHNLLARVRVSGGQPDLGPLVSNLHRFKPGRSRFPVLQPPP